MAILAMFTGGDACATVGGMAILAMFGAQHLVPGETPAVPAAGQDAHPPVFSA